MLHAAAFTNVDGAEADPDGAHAVNADGSRHVARAARRPGAGLVAFSTDYVFDGTAADGYVESDPTGPRSVYGASKLAGEQAVREEHPEAYVVRTAWVFAPRGPTSSARCCGSAAERDLLRVVDDQRGCPTYTGHLAAATRRLLGACPPGTYHLAGGGACSWFELTEAILADAGLDARVEPMTSAELDRPAPGPPARSCAASTPARRRSRTGATACGPASRRSTTDPGGRP